MSAAIYLSTRAAAKLADVEPHVLYTSYRRHGHWRGVTPRKAADGRLSWPADLVRAASVPSGPLPGGADVWIEWAHSVAPELSESGLYTLAVAQYGSEATPGWKPAPGQLGSPRLETETRLWVMQGQALADRIDQANALGGGDVSDETRRWTSCVLRKPLRVFGVAP
jgi:hypothetical protein